MLLLIAILPRIIRSSSRIHAHECANYKRRKRLIPRLYVRVDEWVTRIDGLNLHL